jgi:stearoyl-CoA desaturase (delta-9 desaturase)
MWRQLIKWLDSYNYEKNPSLAPSIRRLTREDWVRCLPYVGMHLACFAVIWVGWSPIALWIALTAYFIRMFAITGFYHRYFSHSAFKTGRLMQFIFAAIGSASTQRGPLWWAAHHRYHHKHSDTESDIHSPKLFGFFWSHTGWFMSESNFRTKTKLVKDWNKFPELIFLDRFDILAPVFYATSLFLVGGYLERYQPQLQTSGGQLLTWGFFISTVALYHGTFTINSLAHVWGTRRFKTSDHSRNNPFLAFITLGEGWHNNHHRYPIAARQGFAWWEFDITFYILKIFEKLGLVWDLKGVPLAVYPGKSAEKQIDSADTNLKMLKTASL